MNKVLGLVETIEIKAVKLKEERDVLKTKNTSLLNEQVEVQLEIDKKNLELNNLKEKVKMLEMANSLKGEGEGDKEMKLKVNELVREIDKCIALLNN